MAKLGNSTRLSKLTPNKAGHGPFSKRIVRGKGRTSPNPAPALEGREKSGGLKGPYHG